ncbi:MAG: DUF898 domain-containing protein [Deltaproteobacteria bacterium]|nr:DUF898 domain-containing protein [Deltaproteobacteria bacterium]
MSDALPSTGEAPPSAPPAAARRLDFEFHATGGEYFRIWIVNLLLTIVTLGIYSAWAKVRRLRYFYGNTRLADAAFEYHGRPIQILKGRLIAVGAYAIFYVVAQLQPLAAIGFLPLFAFGVPWIIMKSRRFQMRMTSYRGIRFGFDGDYRGALGAFIGWPVLGMLTLGILWPRSIWEQSRYILANARYGTGHARFTASRGVFYRFCFVTLGLGAVLYAGAFAGVGGLVGASGLEGEEIPEETAVAVGLAVGVVFLLVSLVLSAYYRKSWVNASFGGLELGPHRVESELETWPLVGLYLSNFALIVLTLGLYAPWATVRQMQYQLANLHVRAQGDLDQFAAAAGDATDAIGEEIGDFFDIDFGL